MITLVLGILIFIQMIEYIVLADVILSWLTLIGLQIRPRFIAHILDPIYTTVKKYIPTQIGPFELTPIIVIFILIILRYILMIAFPEVQGEIHSLMS